MSDDEPYNPHRLSVEDWRHVREARDGDWVIGTAVGHPMATCVQPVDRFDGLVPPGFERPRTVVEVMVVADYWEEHGDSEKAKRCREMRL